MASIVYEFAKIDFHKRNRYIFQLVKDRPLTDVCHAHDFYEFIWFVRGQGIQRINGLEIPCETGGVFLLRPQEEHYFTGQSDDAAVVSLSVEKTELELLAAIYHPQLTESIASGKAPISYPFSYPALIEQFGGEESRSVTEYDCKLLLSCFLKSYIDHGSRINRSDKLPRALEVAVEEMKKAEHLRKGISAFIEVSHYSQSHLSRMIQKCFGMSLKQYINELRLQRAYSELLLTDKTVQGVAEELGYASVSHFQKIFKARFSITPASLRKQRGMQTI